MSFASNVKEELLRLPLGKNCCMLSELSALTQTSGSLSLRGGGHVRVTWRVESAALARRIFLLIRSRLGLTPTLHFVQHSRLGGQRTCVLTLEDQDAEKLLLALHMMEQDETGSISPETYGAAAFHDAAVLPKGIPSGGVSGIRHHVQP